MSTPACSTRVNASCTTRGPHLSSTEAMLTTISWCFTGT